MAAVQWDPFDAIEQDVRTMVADPRWSAVPAHTQAQAMAARLLRTPDGACWLFGAHARWYRHEPSDGEWHLSAPPADQTVRSAAHAPHPAPAVPEPLLASSADFSFDRGSTQAFVGPDVPHRIVEQVRTLLDASQVSRADTPYVTGPLRALFYADVPATVAMVWGTIMWCAYAPAFDGNEVLLSMFGEFLSRPLPGDDWVRWLPPTPLEALVEPYAESHGGAQGTALRLAALAGDTARVLLPDPRFGPRAAALLAMVEPLRARPWLDHAARDAVTVRQAWLARCPDELRGAVLADTSAGEHFRHTLYDLVRALEFVSAHGADPRAVAASLLAADVHAVAPGVAARLYPWMDAELRQTYYVTLAEPRHPLRGCWPREGEPPAALRPPDRGSAAALLGAGYATGLAWCRLTGTPPPPRGFPTSAATVSCLIDERDDPTPGVPGTSAEWIRHT
ncbi:hypothetical protein [Sphaerisporangium corydalis]|uniref:Uncharacterized protein n=1 Tax=Sphaerisporangium corydalis TaxID=1441875 RepID=A0ABV9EPE7_9ACTN|nr:hypothetical protein [Sphaerisporangium corydalis]